MGTRRMGLGLLAQIRRDNLPLRRPGRYSWALCAGTAQGEATGGSVMQARFGDSRLLQVHWLADRSLDIGP